MDKIQSLVVSKLACYKRKRQLSRIKPLESDIKRLRKLLKTEISVNKELIRLITSNKESFKGTTINNKKISEEIKDMRKIFLEISDIFKQNHFIIEKQKKFLEDIGFFDFYFKRFRRNYNNYIAHLGFEDKLMNYLTNTANEKLAEIKEIHSKYLNTLVMLEKDKEMLLSFVKKYNEAVSLAGDHNRVSRRTNELLKSLSSIKNTRIGSLMSDDLISLQAKIEYLHTHAGEQRLSQLLKNPNLNMPTTFEINFVMVLAKYVTNFLENFKVK